MRMGGDQVAPLLLSGIILRLADVVFDPEIVVHLCVLDILRPRAMPKDGTLSITAREETNISGLPPNNIPPLAWACFVSLRPRILAKIPLGAQEKNPGCWLPSPPLTRD